MKSREYAKRLEELQLKKPSKIRIWWERGSTRLAKIWLFFLILLILANMFGV